MSIQSTDAIISPISFDVPLVALIPAEVQEEAVRRDVAQYLPQAFPEALGLLQDHGIRLPRTEQVHVKLTY